MTTKEVFTEIYEKNTWLCDESHSGTGSTVQATHNIRQTLPKLLFDYGIKSILDLPCGDFNWMRTVDLGDCSYLGGDIVDDIVEANNQQYANDFEILDLIGSDLLPQADLIICRDCLVHLSYADIRRAIGNIIESGSNYLWTTTYTARYSNMDIDTGSWRPINLSLSPFNFPNPLHTVNEDYRDYYPGFTDKCMALYFIGDL